MNFSAPTPLFRCIAALLFASAMACSTLPSRAQSPLEAGIYSRQDENRLVLNALVAGKQHFSLHTIGSNGADCSLEGEIEGRQALVRLDPRYPICVLHFEADGPRIKVDAPDTDDACRAYCSGRATYRGDFVRLAPACEDSAKQQTRKHFESLRKARNYAAALESGQKLLQTCNDDLPWREMARWRHDVAALQGELGQAKECLSTLQPVIHAVGLNRMQMESRLPPAEAIDYLPEAKAAWSQQRCCLRASKRGKP